MSGPVTGRPVRIGMLSVAHVHAPWYLDALAAMPDVELTGLWDADPALAAERARASGTTAWSDPDALLAAVDDHRFLTECTGAGNIHLSHQFLGIAFRQGSFFHGCFLIFKTAILRSNRCAAWPAHQFIRSVPGVRRKNINLLLSFLSPAWPPRRRRAI